MVRSDTTGVAIADVLSKLLCLVVSSVDREMWVKLVALTTWFVYACNG